MKGKQVVYTHAHCQYISYSSLTSFRTIYINDELFELSHKNILFVTGCGHINYVDLSMLISWMSVRGDTKERNH